jgi:hypothetical protein
MAEKFYTILTNIGKSKIANAQALGKVVNLTYLAIGDGGGQYYNPTDTQIDLKNEVWRGPINDKRVDKDNSNWIVLESAIPSMDGGFMVREVGVFDDVGDMIAIGKYPETYKPQVQDGSAKDLYIRMILEVANTSVVNLKVDPSIILATKKDVDILSNRVTKNERDIAELKQGSTTIEDLQTDNKTLSGAINELFQSGLDGKNLLETSIKSKGGTVSKQEEIATFNELDLGVKSIITDPSIGTTNAIASDILLGKKAISNGNLITGTIPSKGAATITPTTSPQTIAAGQYLSGVQTIAGVTVPADKVLTGTTIAGTAGTMPSRGAPAQTLTTQGGQYNIPAGYYSGGSVKAQFANLVAENIKEGVNIGGVVGNIPMFGANLFSYNSGGKVWHKVSDKYIDRNFPDGSARELLFSNLKVGTKYAISVSGVLDAKGYGALYTDLTSYDSRHQIGNAQSLTLGVSFVITLFATGGEIKTTSVISVDSPTSATRLFVNDQAMKVSGSNYNLYIFGTVANSTPYIKGTLTLYELR